MIGDWVIEGRVPLRRSMQRPRGSSPSVKRPIAGWFLVISAAAVVSSLSACHRSPAASVTRVDKLFAEWNRSDSPGCSLGVSQNGVVVYERGYGMANLELGVPITLSCSHPRGP